jgi:uncharacterized membrane protein
MFKLTREEQLVVAFVIGAILLGTAVRMWRAHRTEATAAISMETRDR